MRRTTRTSSLVAAAVLAFAGCGGDGSGSATDPGTLTLEGAPIQVEGAARAVDATVAIDEDGTIHVAWSAHAGSNADASSGHDHGVHGGGTGGQHVYVTRSDDAGGSWTEPVRVTRSPDANSFANAHAKLVALGGDDLLLTWPRYSDDGGFYTVRRSTSSDGGRTWSAPMTMREGAGFGAGESYQSAAGVGGAVWSAMLVTPADDQDPLTETSLSVASSLDGGTYWEPGRIADARTCECCDTAIAVDSDERVFVAYRDQRVVDAGDPVRDVSVVRSFDRGMTWSDPVPTGDDRWRSAQCPEAGPEIVVGDDDALHLVEWRGVDGHQGIAYARSSDHGESFERTILVDEAFYPSATVDVAVDGDGFAWVAWDDHSEDVARVHVARVDGSRVRRHDVADAASGEHPAIDAAAGLVVLGWPTEDGEVMVRVLADGGA